MILWNQQTPFAIAKDLKPLFHQRLVDSLTNWDMRDKKADWPPTPCIPPPMSIWMIFYFLTCRSQRATPAIWKSRKVRFTGSRTRQAVDVPSTRMSSTS